jgi:hypothetical protein
MKSSIPLITTFDALIGNFVNAQLILTLVQKRHLFLVFTLKKVIFVP